MAQQTLQLKVDGMSCMHCVKAVKGAVGALAGVDSVDVVLEKNQVTVGFDPAKSNQQAIKAAIEDQGYSVVS